MEFGGFWKRVAASIIDSTIAGVVGYLVGFIVFLPIILEDPNLEESIINFFANILSLIIGWIYFSSFESSRFQGSPGKMALGMVVTDERGQRISFGRASGRFFGKFVSGLLLCIGFIMVGFTEKKQGLHDIMAGCLVQNK
jgi:uncharacterized RDD family membrane protein YckC